MKDRVLQPLDCFAPLAMMAADRLVQPACHQMAELTAMHACYDRQGLAGHPLALRAILGREPRSLGGSFADVEAGRPTTAG